MIPDDITMTMTGDICIKCKHFEYCKFFEHVQSLFNDLQQKESVHKCITFSQKIEVGLITYIKCPLWEPKSNYKREDK